MHPYFYDGGDLSLALDASFDPGIVLLSVALAWLTAYASFNVAERIHASEEGLARRLWLMVGALTMGTGLWAMHFVGMLALRLPVMMRYDFIPTLLSSIPVVATSALLMYYASWPKIGDWALFACGILMAAGIGAMHYVGMFAMRGVDHDLVMQVDPKLFILSVIVAVVFFNGALYLNVLAWRRNPNTRAYWPKIGAALIMALAVARTRYRSDARRLFFPGRRSPNCRHAVFPRLGFNDVVGVASEFPHRFPGDASRYRRPPAAIRERRRTTVARANV